MELLPNSHFLGIGSSLGQLLFGTATFLAEKLLRIKISTEELLCRRSYFCISFFRGALSSKKLIFQKRNIPLFLLFPKSYLFRAVTFSKGTTFCSSYFFRRATFSQHTFSEEFLLHSHASSQQLHLLFIS